MTAFFTFVYIIEGDLLGPDFLGSQATRPTATAKVQDCLATDQLWVVKDEPVAKRREV